MEREKKIDKIENNLFIITEGEVMLTREEYEHLQSVENDLQRYAAELYSRARKAEDGIKEVRKETAKEIWEKGRQLYNEYSDKDIAMNLLAAWIENNFGIEVE